MDERQMSRRDVLRVALALPWVAKPARARQNRRTVSTAVDHLLLGVANLDRGIDWVEQRTGVRAAIGGSHPGAGTRNALLSLGDRRYLEIIAPDPAQTTDTSRTELKTLAEPQLIGWAANAEDIDGVARKGRDGGQQMLGPRDGSRLRPDGKVLKWKTLGVVSSYAANGVDPIPFFIEWAADTVHPSQDSPAGCTLQSFEIEHPNASAVADTLKRLGLEVNVREAERVRLVATIETKKGIVALG